MNVNRDRPASTQRKPWRPTRACLRLVCLCMRGNSRVAPVRAMQACEHAKKAVAADSRMRAWWPSEGQHFYDGRYGLLFKCRQGAVDLDGVVGAPRRSHQVGSCMSGHVHMPVLRRAVRLAFKCPRRPST